MLLTFQKQLNSHKDEIGYLQEALKKCRYELDEQRRLNTSLKQKKVTHQKCNALVSKFAADNDKAVARSVFGTLSNIELFCKKVVNIKLVTIFAKKKTL